jgi:hypothetical protein
MKKNLLAIATVAAALSITATGLAQSKQGMENGKRKGWYKQDKKHDKHDRKDDNRWSSQNRRDDRWSNQNDSRWDNNRYDSRYDNRNDSWRQTNQNDGRYDNRNSTTYQREQDRRQQTKNEWRNIAYGAGAVALLGLLQKDNRLVFGGAAGALYSLYRYEQDRKSQNSLDRARAHYFANDHFTRDGVRYDRRLVTQNGQRYYQFVRAR